MACFKAITENRMLQFVIDEAHCVDTWGKTFRPTYAKLMELKQFETRIVAFTGTATNETKQRIVEKLGLVQAAILQTQFILYFILLYYHSQLNHFEKTDNACLCLHD